MAKKDAALENYFQDSARFADLLNVVLFNGNQVVMPEDVQELDTAAKVSSVRLRRRFFVQKYRDTLRRVALGMNFVVVGVEHQDMVSFAMPVRIMLADAAAYDKQLQKIGRMHRNKRDLKGAEFLSGFSRKDKLCPVFTIVLYYGEDEWQGARELFTFLQNIKDKDSLKKIAQNENFSKLDEDAYEAMAALGEIPDFEAMKDQFKEEGGRINMCKAFEELMESKWLEGKSEGVNLQAEKTAYNMFRRGFSVEDVSAISEMDQKKVAALFNRWSRGKRRN